MKKSKATEAVRVAREVAAMRTALRKYGYHFRKRPKQAAWRIYVTDNHFYMLTYQPAPVSSWVLHPQNDESERHNLEAIIQRVLSPRSASIAGKVS